jgi:hypothetical protein
LSSTDPSGELTGWRVPHSHYRPAYGLCTRCIVPSARGG